MYHHKERIDFKGEKLFTIGEFAQMIGVAKQTLRNWDESGKLVPCYRTPSGYRMYSSEQAEAYFGSRKSSSGSKLT